MRTAAASAMVLAASLLVCGCSLVGESIPEPTEAELAELNEQVRDLQWQILQFSPDSPRPTVEFESYVDPDAADEVYTECMVQAGYPDWQASSVGAFGGPPTMERLALYTCVSRFPLHPGTWGLYSTDQRDAIYDYYRDSLVQCLESSGLDVRDAPTRDEFLTASLFGWTPYSYDFGNSDEEMAAIARRCGDLASALGRPRG
jgi:hypothetical protein